MKLIKKALTEAKELGFKHIALTGGEPILYPEFDELVDLICDFGLSWSIVTNGSLYKKYDNSIDSHKDKLKFITLSLDGGTEATHDFIRQKGSFKKVCEAAEYYKSKGAFVRLNFTLTSKNILEIPEFVKVALSLKVNAIRVAATIPTGYNQNLQVTWAQKVSVYQYVQKLKSEKFPLEISNTTSLYTVTDADTFCGNVNDHEPAINSYGDYIFCCDTIGQGAVLGNLKKEPFSKLFLKGLREAAWLKEERRRRILNKEFFKDFNSCHYCNLMLEDKLKRHKEYERQNELESTSESFKESSKIDEPIKTNKMADDVLSS